MKHSRLLFLTLFLSSFYRPVWADATIQALMLAPTIRAMNESLEGPSAEIPQLTSLDEQGFPQRLTADVRVRGAFGTSYRLSRFDQKIEALVEVSQRDPDRFRKISASMVPSLPITTILALWQSDEQKEYSRYREKALQLMAEHGVERWRDLSKIESKEFAEALAAMKQLRGRALVKFRFLHEQAAFSYERRKWAGMFRRLDLGLGCGQAMRGVAEHSVPASMMPKY